MRWLCLVWVMVVAAATQAAAGTMTTSLPGNNFGSVHVGVTVTTNLTITNTGPGALGFDVASDLADFTANPATGTIPSNGNQLVTISFTVRTRPSQRHADRDDARRCGQPER